MENASRLLPAIRSLASQQRFMLSHFRRFCASDANVKPREIGEISGVPEKHLGRKVVIYSPARTAMQQGACKTGRWKIDFLSTEKWENPLMGWTSTGDPYSYVGDAALKFDSKEDAIEFARKFGWEYTVKEPQHPVLRAKAYADNFKFKGPPPAED
eukprot:c22364_g1_i1 orf=764-1231(-)